MKDDHQEISGRLLSDSTLGQIVRTYESAYPGRLKNTDYSRLAFFATALLALLLWHTNAPYSHIDRTLVNMTNIGISLSGVALGLGLAGVAIYTSSIKPEMLRILANTDYPGTRTSALRFILAAFVYVIVAFLKLCVACAIFFFLFAADSPVLNLVALLFTKPDEAKKFFALMFSPVFAFYFVFAFSNLWSFVFNLHRSIMIIAAAEIVLQSRADE